MYKVKINEVKDLEKTLEKMEGVKQCETQADSVADGIPALLADFNALLAKLKKAGIMAK